MPEEAITRKITLLFQLILLFNHKEKWLPLLPDQKPVTMLALLACPQDLIRSFFKLMSTCVDYGLVKLPVCHCPQ